MTKTTYRIGIVLGYGRCKRTHVDVVTAAETRDGVMRAAGRAIADRFHTDVFEPYGTVLKRDGAARDYDISEWTTTGTITRRASRTMWDAAHDRIFDLIY